MFPISLLFSGLLPSSPFWVTKLLTVRSLSYSSVLRPLLFCEYSIFLRLTSLYSLTLVFTRLKMNSFGVIKAHPPHPPRELSPSHGLQEGICPYPCEQGSILLEHTRGNGRENYILLGLLGVHVKEFIVFTGYSPIPGITDKLLVQRGSFDQRGKSFP